MLRFLSFVSKRYYKYRLRILRPFILNFKVNNKRKTYNNNPKTTIIIQVFNKKGFIKEIIDNLLEMPFDEIILIDDGSIDGTIYEAMKLLTGKNHFILRCNDIYEVRTYQRALEMAKGEIVALIQDDDLLPNNKKWILNAQELFNRIPKLLILGGRDGVNLMIPEEGKLGKTYKYSISNNLASFPGVLKYEVLSKPRLKFNSIPFQFTMVINRAPMWVRRKEFLENGGIDQVFAPYQCDDTDACMRAWNTGWKVGLYNSNFKYSAPSGMSLYNQSNHTSFITEHWKLIYNRYGNKIKNNFFKKIINMENDLLKS